MNTTSRGLEYGVEGKEPDQRSIPRPSTLFVHAHHPPYLPDDLSDGEEERSARLAAARMILSGRPESWLDSAERYCSRVSLALQDHLLGSVQIYLADLDAAEASLARARAQRAHDGRLLASSVLNLAEVALWRGETAEAWSLAAEAASLAPDLPIVHVNRKCIAESALNQDWIDQARQELALAIPRWKRDPFLSEGLGSVGLHYISLI